tara:strand:+ start:503 stop:1048 length:546 start_codon:yes stop_codon:yes gene_type:complete
MLSEEQWEVVKTKYQKLFYHIAHRIGGDGIAHSIEDNYQDLCIACIDAVKAYRKKTLLKFDDFIHTTGFDKYLKTCLWNCKNNKGATITKKKVLNNKVTLEEELIDAEMYHLDSSSVMFEDTYLNDDCRDIVEAIHLNPKLIKPNGSINLNALSKELGKEKGKVKLYITQLESDLSEYWEN